MSSVVIFDFDSTIIPEESLDQILNIALADRPDHCLAAKEIDRITRLGMEGEIDFLDSLKLRFKYTNIHQRNIDQYLDHLSFITDPKMFQLFESLREYGHDIWVVSGAFESWVVPFCSQKLGVLENQIISNQLIFNDHYAVDFQRTNDLIKYGKPCVVQSILEKSGAKNSIMIGDGMTDYAVYDAGIVDDFIGVGIYAKRIHVKQKSLYYVESIAQLDEVLKGLLTN